MSKPEIQKHLDQAYQALNNLKDRKAQDESVDPKSERILQTHIRYLKQLLQEGADELA